MTTQPTPRRTSRTVIACTVALAVALGACGDTTPEPDTTTETTQPLSGQRDETVIIIGNDNAVINEAERRIDANNQAEQAKVDELLEQLDD